VDFNRIVTDALSTILQLLGEELKEASWLVRARSRIKLVEPCCYGRFKYDVITTWRRVIGS